MKEQSSVVSGQSSDEQQAVPPAVAGGSHESVPPAVAGGSHESVPPAVAGGSPHQPNSRKIYVESNNLRVPFREIALTPSRAMDGTIEENAPVRVYDTGGPWTDP